MGISFLSELNSSELNSSIPVHFSFLIPRMSTFTLAMSCLTTSNLPWFMDLTFQVPLQYCSLQQRTLLLLPVTSTTGYCFCFGSIPSFFLGLFLHWSPVAYWAPTTWGIPLSVSYHFAFSSYSWGSQGKNTEVVCHSLLQWTTYCQTSPPWPDHLGRPHMAWLSFIELDKPVVLWSDWLVSVIMVSVCLPSDALLEHPPSYLGFSGITPDNHDGVITHLEPDILECEVRWALESITTSKASGGDGMPVELFQILKDDAVKVLHSICQQTWKTQQWPQN